MKDVLKEVEKENRRNKNNILMRFTGIFLFIFAVVVANLKNDPEMIVLSNKIPLSSLMLLIGFVCFLVSFPKVWASFAGFIKRK